MNCQNTSHIQLFNEALLHSQGLTEAVLTGTRITTRDLTVCNVSPNGTLIYNQLETVDGFLPVAA